MKVKAAVLYEMGKDRPYSDSNPLALEEVELENPQAGEILVQIHAAGLCHSDLSVIDGNRPRQMPMVLGHEAAGEVVELGPDVKDLAIGDHVVFSFVPVCGNCMPCRTARPALCEKGVEANNKGVLFAGVIPALEFTYDATARGGKTVTAGLPHPGKKMQFAPVKLVAEERTLQGSYLGSCIPSRDIPAYITLYQSGRLPVDKLMTHKLSLNEINEGFERLAKGEAIRQIITF